jgi:hypothetical protein
LTFISEGVGAHRLPDNRWELHVRFTIHNPFACIVYLNDIRAHEYLSSSDNSVQMTLDRATITLYQDNSIMSGGHVYDIPPNSMLPIDLVLYLTRDPDQGYLMEVFGLFVHCYYVNHGTTTTTIIPSTAVYVFQDPPTTWGQTINFTEEWAASAIESAPSKKHLIERILRLLRAHAKRGTPHEAPADGVL